MNKHIRTLLGMIHHRKQISRTSHAHQRPTIKTPEEWHTYWQEQGQPWRTEPEIPLERQQELSKCRFITPEIEKGIYPFKRMKLSRSDVEWLLATHENGRGPVDWSDQSQREREGLDLRGAILSGANLHGLPLTRLRSGLSRHEWFFASQEQREKAAVYLEETSLGMAHLEGAELSGAHLERADLRYAFLQSGILIEAHLEEAWLQDTHAEGAAFYGAHLTQADFTRAHLEGARLGRTPPQGQAPLASLMMMGPLVGPYMRQVVILPAGADLREARLIETHLEGAELWEANLQGACLWNAFLEGARLTDANLTNGYLCLASFAGADLTGTRLEGADLRGAHLEGKRVLEADLERISQWLPSFPAKLPPADLRYAHLNDLTLLDGIVLGEKEGGYPRLVRVRWNNVDLSVVDWRQVELLGDERLARLRATPDGSVKSRELRFAEYQDAVRANRQLATVLQAQGLNEEAAHFAYRAHVLQRAVLRLQFTQPRVNLGQRLRACFSWLFSLFLALIAGYGYRPGRSVLAYLIIIFGFMGLYLVTSLLGGPHLRWDEALVLSVSSFHGRGFFSQSITLGDAYARIAALEAVVGLLIEISFIATFTQRFLGK